MLWKLPGLIGKGKMLLKNRASISLAFILSEPTSVLGLRIEENDKQQAIILAPTRELCEQIYNVAIELSKLSKITIEKCVGGTTISNSKDKLRKANLIIG